MFNLMFIFDVTLYKYCSCECVVLGVSCAQEMLKVNTVEYKKAKMSSSL